MSAQLSKESIQDLFASLIAEDEYLERQASLMGPEAEMYRRISGAQAALLRSAGAQPADAYATDREDQATRALDAKLRKYACDFIKAAYLLLGALDRPVPGDARDFVLMLMAASGGHSDKRLIITDERLAGLSGLSTKTIGRKRHAYRAWEKTSGWTVVEIHEQPRKGGERHYAPTEYRVVFSEHVAAFVRKWRTFYQQRLAELPAAPGQEEDDPPALWDEMRQGRDRAAFAESTSPATIASIASEVSSDFGMAPIKPRDKSANQGGPQKDALATGEARMLSALADCRDAARKRGRAAYSWWEDFKRKAAIVLSEPTPGYPDPEDAD